MRSEANAARPSRYHITIERRSIVPTYDPGAPGARQLRQIAQRDVPARGRALARDLRVNLSRARAAARRAARPDAGPNRETSCPRRCPARFSAPRVQRALHVQQPNVSRKRPHNPFTPAARSIIRSALYVLARTCTRARPCIPQDSGTACLTCRHYHHPWRRAVRLPRNLRGHPLGPLAARLSFTLASTLSLQAQPVRPAGLARAYVEQPSAAPPGHQRGGTDAGGGAPSNSTSQPAAIVTGPSRNAS